MMGEVVAEWPLFLRIILSPILLIYFGARVYVLPCIGIAFQRALRCCCRGILKHVCCGCGLTFTDGVSGGVVGCSRVRSCCDTLIQGPKSQGMPNVLLRSVMLRQLRLCLLLLLQACLFTSKLERSSPTFYVNMRPSSAAGPSSILAV